MELAWLGIHCKIFVLAYLGNGNMMDSRSFLAQEAANK